MLLLLLQDDRDAPSNKEVAAVDIASVSETTACCFVNFVVDVDEGSLSMAIESLYSCKSSSIVITLLFFFSNARLLLPSLLLDATCTPIICVPFANQTESEPSLVTSLSNVAVTNVTDPTRLHFRGERGAKFGRRSCRSSDDDDDAKL